MRRTRTFDHLIWDLRYGSRSLLKSPGFASAAILSVALGIGANTAIFSIIDKLLLEALPVERPRELVLLNPGAFRSGWVAARTALSYQSYLGLRDGQKVFTGLLAERTDDINLTLPGNNSLRATASVVSGNYFDVLGVRPLLGRVLSEYDDKIRGGHPVAVVSHGFWVERLGSRQDIIGQTVRIAGNAFTVVGVSEKGFNGLEVGGSIDVFVPVMMLPQVVTYGDALDARTSHIFQVYGRLKPGVSRQQAEAQLQPLFVAQLEQNIAALGPRGAPKGERWRQSRLLLEDGHRGTSGLRQDLRTPLAAVMAMTALVLLITGANIAGLQIARAASRVRELSIRLAIGASRGCIVRQLFTESTLIAFAGGLAGLPVAWLLIRVLIAEMGEAAERVRLETTFLDARVLLFAFGVSALTALLFGVFPAVRASRASLMPGLKTGVTSEGTGQLRLRKLLVTAQVALGLVLVSASGLFVRTLQNLRGTETGFRTDRLIQFHLNAGAAGYDRMRSEALFHNILEDLRAIPGVSSATLAVAPVLGNSLIGFGLDIEGYTHAPGEDSSSIANAVAPGYFAMVGTPLVRGRDFSDADTAHSRRVAIVSESFVRKYFPASDPVGHKIGLGYGPPTRLYHEIVGVAKDARLNNLRDEPVRTFYLPYTQFDVLSNTFFLLRTGGNPELVRRPIQEVVRRHDPDVPVVAYRTLEEQIDRLLRPERLVAWLSLAFGLLAVSLAAIGLYGVMTFSVSRRTPEIGIRMALGAEQGAVIRMVLRDAVAMAVTGIVAGAALSLALGKHVEAQLYGVSSHDAATLAAAAALLAAVAITSGWLPARRASRVDPMLALRHD
jgi:predicted permease